MKYYGRRSKETSRNKRNILRTPLRSIILSKGREIYRSFHGKVQSRKHACQWGARMHENIWVHARHHQSEFNQKVERQHPQRNDERDNSLFKGRAQSRQAARQVHTCHKNPKGNSSNGDSKVQSTATYDWAVENLNKNKFCEFHGDKGHSTDEGIHLRRQIEEAVRSGQLSHLVKEIKQGGKRGEHTKATKKGETPNKQKATAIFMVQPWQQMTRQKITQSFSTGREISFSPLASSGGQENPIVIEAEGEGHLIHCMYVDGGSGSVSEVLYEPHRCHVSRS
ncbi:hypothetical protein Tco_0968190 [Tanacetum coccineum]